MGMAHVEFVHRDSCRYKVKGFYAVSSIERNVSKTNLHGNLHGMYQNGICMGEKSLSKVGQYFRKVAACNTACAHKWKGRAA